MKTVSAELQPCLRNRSGIGTYAYELAKRLANASEIRFQGNAFNFCGRNDNKELYADLKNTVKENRFIPYSAFRACQYGVPIPYSFLFGHSDVNLFFNYIIPDGVTGKAITTVHDMAYIRFPETLKKRNLFRLNSGMRKTIKRADRILTVSEFSKREIMELLGIPEDRISIVPCAASEKCQGSDFAAISEKFGIRKPYLLFVSTIEPRKNVVRLLQAFDMLKEQEKLPHQLVLAGGTGWANEDIFRTAREIKNKTDVIFPGFVSSEEKTSLYENADCFVFPSLYEGFGIPLLEAMQCGCPVVCADTASLPEAAGDAAVYADPYDTGSIAERIWKVISDSTLRSELTERGYIRSRKFSWDSSAEILKKICEEI